jgi:hypothetical protein
MSYPFFQGTSPPAPQQWYQQPQQAAPRQGDFIDEATRILNFVEALQQRGGNQQQQTAPTTEPSQYSVSNFQSRPSAQIGDQERRLAEMASAPVGKPNNNLEATLQQQVQTLSQGFQAAMEERDLSYKIINSLLPFVQVNQILNQEISQMEQAINSLLPFVQVNQILNQEISQMEQAINSLAPFVQVAQIWSQDALAHEQVLSNVLQLVHDPEFLVYWASQVWNQSIGADGIGAVEWISDEYLKLLDTYEQRYQQHFGKHSPMWQRMQPKMVNPVMGSPETQSFAQANTQYQPPQQFQQPAVPQQYQQQQAPPMPPIPGNTPGVGAIDQLRQKIEMLKAGTPDLAQQLQRAHSQSRQMGSIQYV